jgi:hypothetical protein
MRITPYPSIKIAIPIKIQDGMLKFIRGRKKPATPATSQINALK